MTDGPPTVETTQGRLQIAVESVLGNVFADGNHIEVLRNGDEIFPAMLAAIEQAKSSIDFVTFVYWTGEIADRFGHALAARASDGVLVRVVLDAFGSSPMEPSLIDDMREAGVLIERFRPVVRWKFWESDHRTHRKILVCDNEVAFTGGVGIADEWSGDAANPDEWRDTHFRLTGPAVMGLRAAFLTDWRDAGHAIDRSDITVRRPDPSGDMRIAVVDGSAQIGVNDPERLLEASVSAAENKILIQTPYFNPTDGLIEALDRARLRGVEIDVIVPGPHIDKRISAVVAAEQYVPLTDHGIRVWVYQRSMMHVKAVLVDDALAIVGSVNVNRRSVEKDEEVALCVLDSGVVAELTAHFDDDKEASTAAGGTQTAERSLVEKVLAFVTKPIRREM
jgi:cardiolipin synthase